MSVAFTPCLQTMKKSYEEILLGKGGTPWVPLGNFMNDFFRNHPEQRTALIADALEMSTDVSAQKDQSIEAEKWAVFCAASVRHLARRYKLSCPQWALDPKYITPLPDAWYFSPMAYKKEAVRLMDERETPPEFAEVRIYCGEVYVDKYEKAQEFRAWQLRQVTYPVSK